jgi:hypothetical protein
MYNVLCTIIRLFLNSLKDHKINRECILWAWSSYAHMHILNLDNSILIQ